MTEKEKQELDVDIVRFHEMMVRWAKPEVTIHIEADVFAKLGALADLKDNLKRESLVTETLTKMIALQHFIIQANVFLECIGTANDTIAEVCDILEKNNKGDSDGKVH